MDEHVSRAITLGLRRRGVDVLTAQEDEKSGASDEELIERSTLLGRVLFTQDDDLLAEAARRRRAGLSFAGLVYAHQLKITIGQAVEDLHVIAQAVDPGELADNVLFLPL